MSFKFPPNPKQSTILWSCGSCVWTGIQILLQEAVQNKILQIALSKRGVALNALHFEKKKGMKK